MMNHFESPVTAYINYHFLILRKAGICVILLLLPVAHNTKTTNCIHNFLY